MATRLYLPSSGSAPVTPSTWNFANQINPLTFAAVKTRISSAMTTKSEATGTTNPTARAMFRWVIGPLAAQTISGTVKGQFRCAQNNNGANATLALAIKIIQPNGTDRAVLLAQTASDDTSAAPPEMVLTTLTNRRFQNAAESFAPALTSQSATAGDYLVIEVGFRSATGTTRNISISYGDDNESDLGENSTDTTAFNPWIEFSGNIAFQYSLAIDPGSYALTGSNVGLKRGYPVGVGVGSYSQTGSDIGLKHGYKVPVDVGSYALTGSDVGLAHGYKTAIDVGSYNLTGTDVGLKLGYKIPIDSGSYSQTGSDVTLTYTPFSSLTYGFNWKYVKRMRRFGISANGRRSRSHYRPVISRIPIVNAVEASENATIVVDP
jgi:hypothetical protein